MSARRTGRRRASTDCASVSEEGKTEPGDGGGVRDSFRRGDSSSGVSTVRLDGVFAHLRRFEEEHGTLAISVSHPTFISILDALSDIGMEELLKKRFYQQLDSLRDFSKRHGDCRVPLEHPILGRWVRVQHGHYKLFKERLPSPMTRKRFAQLGEIAGFDEFEDPDEERGDGATDDDDGSSKAEGRAASDASLALDEKIRRRTEAGVGLTLDEKIRLKAEAKKARSKPSAGRGGAGARGAASSPPRPKKLPDKETVAAEMRRKRERGTAHRSATALTRSLVLKDLFHASSLNPDADDEEEDAPRRASSSGLEMSASTSTLSASSAGRYERPTKDATKSWTKMLREENRNATGKKTGEERRGSSMHASSKNDDAECAAGAGKNRKATRKKFGEEHRSASMPVGSTNDAVECADEGRKSTDVRFENKPRRRATRDTYLSASSLETSRSRSKFQDLLQRKIERETPGEATPIRRATTDRETSFPIRRSSTTNDIFGSSSDDDSLGSLKEFHNAPTAGRKSKADALDQRAQSLSALDATPSSTKQFSRWKLLFREGDYGDKKAQSDCVSSVLNNVIYAERWNLVPEENGDIALEMATETLDEHNMVEIYADQLIDRYSKSDFFFY